MSKQLTVPKQPAIPKKSPVSRNSQIPGKPSMPRQIRKRQVKFAPDTIFEPGRRCKEFWRVGPFYMAGKYARLRNSRGCVDTSFMTDTVEEMLNLKVYATYTVDSMAEFNDIHDEFVAHMDEGKPLSPGQRSTLRDHALCYKVLDEYADHLRRCVASGSTLAKDKLAEAKVLVVYQGQNGGLLGFQFLKDTWDDAEAAEYLEQLKDEIPPDNQGLSPSDVLDAMQKR